MRKTLSLLLCLVMTVCVLSPALAVDVKLPLVEEPFNVTIMVNKEQLCQNTWPEKECVQFTEKQTNVHVEWNEIPSSGWTEKVNLSFASGNLPDAYIGGIDVCTNMDSLAAIEGYFSEETTPNIMRNFTDLPDLYGALKLSDGHIYSLPTGDADVKNNVGNELWINTEWLKAVGMDMPTTIDEFYDVLVAFRDKDPNGNGIQDEIPLLVSDSSSQAELDEMFGLFGTADNSNHVRVQDGKVIFTPAEDAYFQALQWFAKLYAEGLMNQEYFTEDNDQFLAKGHADTCIAGVAKEWYIDNVIGGQHVPNFTFVPPLEGPNGMMIWPKGSSPQGSLNGFAITTACENPEVLVRWYDYINSDLDILNLWNYGPEGVMWRYTDDGRWEIFTDNVPEGSSSSQVRRTVGTGPASPIYAYAHFRGPDVEVFADRILAKTEANIVYMTVAPAESIPNGFGIPEEEAERNMILVEIDHYLDQFLARAVVNGITEEEWQTHLKTLDTLDIDEYIGYWQSYYDAHI